MTFLWQKCTERGERWPDCQGGRTDEVGHSLSLLVDLFFLYLKCFMDAKYCELVSSNWVSLPMVCLFCFNAMLDLAV